MILIGQKQPMEVFYKNIILKISQNLQESICVGISFFNKFAGLKPATLLKKRPQYRCFFCGFCKTFKNIFFTEQLQKTASYWASYFCDDSVWSIVLVGLKSEKSKKTSLKLKAF